MENMDAHLNWMVWNIGFNNNAKERAIVVHGADLCFPQETIDQFRRLERIQGSPALASKLAKKVINTMADRTVLFINNSEQYYMSQFLNEQLAAELVLN